jgi:type IV pilus assembly protein PilE
MHGRLDKTNRRKTHGFTLIEMLITMAIIAIIASIAIPSYQESVRKSRRSDAQSALAGFANAMERHYTTNNNSYLGAGAPNTGAPTVFPTQSPLDGASKYYNLTISVAAADGNSYTLRATPIAPGPQAGDGILELDNTGARRWDEDDNGIFGATENDWEVN